MLFAGCNSSRNLASTSLLPSKPLTDVSVFQRITEIQSPNYKGIYNNFFKLGLLSLFMWKRKWKPSNVTAAPPMLQGCYSHLLLLFFNLKFFSFIFISWRLITLQYCSGLCHTLTWISHGFTLLFTFKESKYFYFSPLAAYTCQLSTSKMRYFTNF